TGYRDVGTVFHQDYAESFMTGFRSFDDIQYHAFSQEVQAVGSLLEGRIDYVAGLYYFKESGRHFQNVLITDLFPPPLLLSKDRVAEVESKSQSAFAQQACLSPVLDGRLVLTFAARYTKDERSSERNLLYIYFGFTMAQEPAPGLVNSNDVESSQFNP